MTEQANFDAHTEQVVLGCILLDASLYAEASSRLRVDDFYLASHRMIFERMGQLDRDHRAIDFVTIQQVMGQDELKAVGGVSYITSLTDGLPRRLAITEYATIVAEKSMLRRIERVCAQTAARAAAGDTSAESILNTAIRDLEDATLSNSSDQDLHSVGQWINENDIFAQRTPGLKTGIDEYDELTYGLHKGELTMFAGRSSMGKTSHCGTIAWEIARRGHSVAVFINEQAERSFIGHMLCGRAGVSYNAYRRGTLDWVERQYIESTREEFRKLPIFIDQRSSMSVASIRAKSARLKRSGELDVVLIDQLSRVSREGIFEKGMRTDEVIGGKVSAIKGMAVDLDVPVGLYHQLNRATTKNEGGRPSLENLKNSGEIEEHADNVALFHRPGYYDQRDSTLKGKDEIIIAKQREGPVGVAECEFVPETCCWRNRKK
jgi:replicative DNA helicase